MLHLLVLNGIYFQLEIVYALRNLVIYKKLGDSIMASYNTVATIAHLWLIVMLLSYLIGFNISVLIMREITSIIVLLLILQIIFRYIIDKKYRLKQCYNFLVKFKENEDVVGEENDYEVRFIQTYNAIKSEKGWNIVWIIYIVLMAIFFNPYIK